MEQYYSYDHHSFDRVKAERGFRMLVANPTLGRLWLIDAGDQLAVGYLAVSFGFSLECGGREAFVDELFVLESLRGKGVGTKAIQHAIAECAREGISALRLEVTKENPDALKLYLKLGFQDLGRHLLTRWIPETHDADNKGKS